MIGRSLPFLTLYQYRSYVYDVVEGMLLRPLAFSCLQTCLTRPLTLPP